MFSLTGRQALLWLASLTITAVTALPQTGGTRTKSGQTSCDGALDMVPSKSVSFVRKRRPNKQKGAPVTESKTARKNGA